MTTMSDECERTCPLCAEEMDLTDQQLKACKCGYEICVWCWHHIIDIAEKDDTEGRCPACRTPYDKEKIVGTAANCERMVAEINSERKLKSQKAKPKASEGRKHLSSVRVIQRNLVYVIGIPANLADEDTLERKEYFGQYGKVLKISISWPTGGGQNSSSNNTVSVYITYTKEEEAVRCIQLVHGFTLDGRSLRACFGTTKYCHTWLRSMPCSNPDCLYLHEVGVQEDSFTKDEIISAYTRSRVQQITGVANNNFQRRSGNVLPPSSDDFCISGTASSVKLNIKNSSTNSTTQVKVSPPSCSSGRSSVLPPAASWGLRGSNCRPPAVSTSCAEGPTKTTDTVASTVFSSEAPIATLHSTLPSDVNQASIAPDRVLIPVHSSGRSDSLELSRHSIDRESQFTGNISTDAVLDSVSELGKIFESSESSTSLANAESEKSVGKVEAGASEIDQNVESSIISSILSLDLDSWDDPLTSSSNLAKMFGESDGQNGSIGLPSSWKQNSQSRFSFARQEDLMNQTNHLDPSFGSFALNVQRSPGESSNFFGQKHKNGFAASGYEDLGGHFNSQTISSSKAPASRAQMSAPPGFSVPNRSPPGFSSQERLYPAFDSTSSGNPLLENPLSTNLFHVPNGSTGTVGDVEFIDPAILAVGKGRLPLGISNSGMDLSPHYPAMRHSNESDLRLQLLLQQQSLSAHQNFRISDQMDDRYSTIKDGYTTSRLLGQTEEKSFSHFAQMSLQQSRNQQFSSGQWGSWSEVQNGNEMGGVTEFVRNQRVGFNKYFSGYDELKVRMPSSGEIYKSAFGI
ncbi:putative general negative regulator of transcription C16C9.04c isoform X4 [Aristolochia californica]|uniref:putative general negative regulator of transcription C16C9.04c isoform X4 n=1 Tax=Aristolochia californica TaxID=171875 RepID=UPI0035DB6930